MDLPLIPLLCQALMEHLDKPLTKETASEIVGKVAASCYPGPVNAFVMEPQEVGSYIIHTARLDDCIDGLRDLHQEHWRETEGHRHAIELNMDYTRMRDLEAQGRYALVVARHRETGQVVANFGTYLSVSAHTKTLMGTEDTLFVSKPHRKGRLGVALMKYTENYLVALGARELQVSVKLVNNIGDMVERLGYAPTSKTYTKIIGGSHVLT